MKPLQMVWCAWWEETVPGRVVSRCFTTVTGGRCVTTAGASSMQRWSADSWATGTTVLNQHHVQDFFQIYFISRFLTVINKVLYKLLIFCLCPCYWFEVSRMSHLIHVTHISFHQSELITFCLITVNHLIEDRDVSNKNKCWLKI